MEADVTIVGAGPAGQVLASTIAQAGFSVALVERWPTPFPLPRMITLDGECCRIVQATSDDVNRGFMMSSIQEACHFVDRNGEPLMSVPFDGRIGGWPARVSVFQPDFERGITDLLDCTPHVSTLRGWEARQFEQDADGVTLTIARFDAEAGVVLEETRTIRSRYLVGADGTNSFVRRRLGIEFEDFQLHERWLNFDAVTKRPLPAHFDRLSIFMDPARPHMYMPIGRRYLRLEFRVMDDETDAEVTDPAVAWDFLTRKHGLGPDDVEIMRQVVYHYYSRVAQQWRDGRVFLAGDAIHTMPPYMGQGGCAAIRDGRNLGWKLVEVLSGRSDDTLLDSYEVERRPHVTTLVMGSDALSRMVNIVDPAIADHRDHDMRVGGSRQPPPLPKLTAGILHRDDEGGLPPSSGAVAPQGTLRRGVRWGLGDDVLGSGFQLWSLGAVDGVLSAETRAWLAAQGVSVAVFDDVTSPDFHEDCDDVYRAFLRQHDAEIIIVRPDFYVFGGAASAGAEHLVDDLAQQLSARSWAARSVVAAA